MAIQGLEILLLGGRNITLKKNKNIDGMIPKLERIDKIADDVKQLKFLTNLIIKKLETRR